MFFSLIFKEKMLVFSKQGIHKLPKFYDMNFIFGLVLEKYSLFLPIRIMDPRLIIASLNTTDYGTINTTTHGSEQRQPQAGFTEASIVKNRGPNRDGNK